LVLPISTEKNRGIQALETIKIIKSHIPDSRTVIGLSNISYGLPKRELLNQTFIVLAISAGVNAAILNPLDKRLMSLIIATETVLAKDEYCMNYINAFRKGQLLI